MLCAHAIARGDHVSVDYQLPQGPAPNQDLRLLIGQPQVILSIKGDYERQQAAI